MSKVHLPWRHVEKLYAFYRQWHYNTTSSTSQFDLVLLAEEIEPLELDIERAIEAARLEASGGGS